MVSKLLWLFTTACFAALISSLLTPLVWFILRLTNLINLLAEVLTHDLRLLMYLGGLLIGLLIGGLLILLIGKTIARVDGWVIACGLVGGAIGGYASSLMFFPVVAIL